MQRSQLSKKLTKDIPAKFNFAAFHKHVVDLLDPKDIYVRTATRLSLKHTKKLLIFFFVLPYGFKITFSTKQPLLGQDCRCDFGRNVLSMRFTSLENFRRVPFILLLYSMFHKNTFR